VVEGAGLSRKSSLDSHLVAVVDLGRDSGQSFVDCEVDSSLSLKAYVDLFSFRCFFFGNWREFVSPFKLCLVLALVVKATLKEMLPRVNIHEQKAEQKAGRAIGRWKLWHDPIVDGQGRWLGTIRSDGRKTFVLETLAH
jgi:hypothetical protein